MLKALIRKLLGLELKKPSIDTLKGRTLGQLERDRFQNLSEVEKESMVSLHQVFQRLRNKLENELPPQFYQAHGILLKEFGWHIRLDMSFDGLVPYIKQGTQEIDRYFIKSIQNSIPDIREKAIRRFSGRKRTIELAFTAHNRGEYELSVPSLLILSEGIFRDISGYDLFSKKTSDKEAFIKSLKENKRITALTASAIEAVINGEIIGLGFSNKEDEKYPNVLHRNRIIHGIDTTYATLVNSCKALSQFEFITSTMHFGLESDFES